LLQVPVPVPVLKVQVPVQVPVLCMQVQVPVPVLEKCTEVSLQLKYPVPVPSTTRLAVNVTGQGQMSDLI